MASLKEKLNQAIKEKGYLSLNEAYFIGAQDGHKQKTCERELNPSRNSNVVTIKNDKGHIVGYRYKQDSAPRTIIHPQPIQTDTHEIIYAQLQNCCVWGGRNNLHASDCPLKVAEKKLQTLI